MRSVSSKTRARRGLLLAGLVGCGVAWLIWPTAALQPEGAGSEPLEHEALTAGGSPHVAAAAETAENVASDRSSPARSARPAAGPATARTDAPGLEGSLVWHDSVDHRAFTVAYKRAGERTERSLRLGRRGVFVLRGLDPGPVTVLVRAAGYRIPLHTVPDVVVPAVGGGRDRRIERMDVTSVRRVTLFYCEAGGRPIDGELRASCMARGESVEFASQESDVRRGALSVLLCAPGQTVVASAAGYQRQRLVVSDNQTVVLRRGAHVRVHLQVHGGAGEVRYVDLHLETPAAARARRQGLVATRELAQVESLGEEFDVARRSAQATFAVFKPGTYHVSWSVLGGSPDPERVPVGVVEIHALGTDQDVWLRAAVEELYTASGRGR